MCLVKNGLGKGNSLSRNQMLVSPYKLSFLVNHRPATRASRVPAVNKCSTSGSESKGQVGGMVKTTRKKRNQKGKAMKRKEPGDDGKEK